MNGKRVGTMRKTTRRYEPRRQRTATTENRASGRLLVCGVALVLLVALKLLFPQQVSAFLQDASRFIGRDANFSEAFAAVGRAVSGEGTVGRSLQDAFLAVFGSSEVEVEREATDDVPEVSPQTEPQSLSATTTLLPTQEQGSTEDSQDTPDTPSTPDNQDAPQNTQDAAEGTEPSSTYTMQSLPTMPVWNSAILAFPVRPRYRGCCPRHSGGANILRWVGRGSTTASTLPPRRGARLSHSRMERCSPWGRAVPWGSISFYPTAVAIAPSMPTATRSL